MLAEKIHQAISWRNENAPREDDAPDGARRLFHGFTEGPTPMVLDRYGSTLVVHDYSDTPEGDERLARAAVEAVASCPGIALRAAVWKVRRGRDASARNGRMLLGTVADLDDRVREAGVWYALALTLNRDASFYLDTRGLRAWAREKLGGLRVLNTFAYTGSLGVAARAAPAAHVVQLDRNRSFLDVARRSYQLNGFAARRGEFVAADFFDAVARMKREGALYDCAFVDPPFFPQRKRAAWRWSRARIDC